MIGETLLLFVYGSLMRGQEHACELRDACWVGAARTAAAYTLVAVGRYPALLAGGAHAVAGELYEVPADDLPRLDAFEQHPDVYQRAAVQLADGRVVQGYLMPAHRARGAELVPSGDWRRRS